MNAEERIVKIKRMNVNAKSPVRGTAGAAGYALAAVQSAVVPAHSKCLVKIGLAIAIPPDCYGRIAPRSGLALKNFIDVRAGVIDSDYRGEIGVVLFNFSNEDFAVNMGDKIAQLIFEKIKTPELKETNELGETGRGISGYGSTGIKTDETEISSVSKVRATPINQSSSVQSKEEIRSNQEPKSVKKFNKQSMNEPTQHIRK